MQFGPPDDEHMCTKHVEASDKLIVKQTFCASSWLITEINILRCTVSKTSKNLITCLQIYTPFFFITAKHITKHYVRNETNCSSSVPDRM